MERSSIIQYPCLWSKATYATNLCIAKTILANGKFYCSGVAYDDLMDFYQWTIERTNGRDVSMPDVNTTVGGRYGPYTIAYILSNPQLTDTTWGKDGLIVSTDPTYFWLGLREYLADNSDKALRYFGSQCLAENAI
ncbi:MAG: hypothetical protein AAGD25_34310 [Cyanobacteria bacterium P01_F01_bin.150]